MTIIQRPTARTDTRRQTRATDPVTRFARGEISRGQAMAALGGITYADLIDRVADRGLRLPSLPDGELSRMADDMLQLLDSAV